MSEGAENSQLSQAPISRKKFSLCLGICLFFTEGMSYAQHGPFFPTEAKLKNSSVTWIGVISGSYDLFSLICSLIFPFFTDPKKSHLYFVLGSFLVASSCFSFGLTNLIQDTRLFNYVCLGIRSVMGIGGTLIWQNAIPLLVELDPKKTSMIPGLIEAALALGYIIGPAFGSFMYSIGGYKLPFIWAGSIHLCMALVGFFIFQSPSFPKNNADEMKNNDEKIDAVTNMLNQDETGNVATMKENDLSLFKS